MAESALSKLNFYPDSGTQKILSVLSLKERKRMELVSTELCKKE